MIKSLIQSQDLIPYVEKRDIDMMSIEMHGDLIAVKAIVIVIKEDYVHHMDFAMNVGGLNITIL